MKFTFADVVIVEENLIGVIVKSWQESTLGTRPAHHEVYVRNFNKIKEYEESEMRRYMVRHKELNEEELMYQENIESA